MDDPKPQDEPVVGPRRRSLARNVASLLASQGATWLLGTALVLVQPRLLGPVQVGRLQLATSIWAIATVIGTWGTTNVLLVEVARDPGQGRRLTRTIEGLRARLMLAVAVPVAGYALAAGYSRATIGVLALVGLASWVQALAMVRRSTLLALEEVGAIGRVDIATKFANVALVLAALALGAAAAGVAAVGIAIALVGLVLFGRALARATDPTDVADVGSHLRGRKLLRAGTPYFFIEATTIAYLQIDAIIISLLVGEEQLGWYAVASFIFTSLLFAPTIAMSALFPTFARGHAHAPEEAAELLGRVSQLLLTLGVWIGVGTIVVSRPLTDLVFGARFDGAAPVLAVYGIVIMLSYQTITLGTYAITTDRATLWSKIMLVAIAGTVVLDLVLVPVMRDRYDNGALAGPTSYAITEAFQLVIGLTLLARHLVSRRMALHVVRVGLAGLAMYVASAPFADSFVLVPAMIGTLAFALALAVVGGIDQDDRQLLRRVRSIGSRG